VRRRNQWFDHPRYCAHSAQLLQKVDDRVWATLVKSSGCKQQMWANVVNKLQEQSVQTKDMLVRFTPIMKGNSSEHQCQNQQLSQTISNYS